MPKLCIGLAVAICICICISATVQGLDVQIESFRIMPETDKDYVNPGTLRLKRKSRNNYVISGELEYFMNTGNDFVELVDFIGPDGRTIYKIEQKFCDFLKNSFYPSVKDYSNIPNICPLPKGKYWIKDLEFQLNPLLPMGKYVTKVFTKRDDKIMWGSEVVINAKAS